MFNGLKTTGLFIGLGAFGVAHAGFDIVPASTSVSVSSTGSATVIWTVTNTAKSATLIYLKTLNSSGGNPENSTAGLSGSGCGNNVPVKGTCTFTMEINGAQLAQSTVVVSPELCGFSGQFCNQASSSNRLTITRYPTPNPNGSWSIYPVSNTLTFPEFVAINNSQMAVGGMDNNYSPAVWLCPVTPGACTAETSGLSSYDFNAITEMDFDNSGNLFGLFTQTQDDSINPTRSYTMKLGANANSWDQFNSATNGKAFGLDTHSASTIFTSSTFKVPISGFGTPSFGSARASAASNGAIIERQTNIASSNLTGIVDDGKGVIYVAGTVSNYSISPTPETYSMVWIWNPTANTYTEINMPTNIPTITAMVSDGNGTIYISGLDNASDAHVWRYSNGVFADTGLTAESVVALEYAPKGYLLAAGVDNTNYDGAVWYYFGGVWKSLNLPDSASAVSISVNADNTIAVVGEDSATDPTTWIFK